MTWEQVIEIMSKHYAKALQDGGRNPDRVMRLFTDRVTEDLKRVPPRTPMRSDE